MKAARFTIPLLLIVFWSNPSWARQKSDWQKYMLVGHVRTVRAFETFYPDKATKLTQPSRSPYATLSFSKDGRLVKSAAYATPADTTLSIADTPLSEPIDSLGMRFYRYDSTGNLSKVVLRSISGEYSGYTLYSYSSNALHVIASHHDVSGFKTRTEELIYDTRGNLVEYIHRDTSGSELGREEYKYDNEGNQLERITYNVGGDNEGAPVRILFKYDHRRNVVEIIETGKNDVVFSRSTYEYDGGGNPVLETTYDPDGVVSKVEKYGYTFDSKGNWIKKRKDEWKRLLKEGELTYMGRKIITRYISYY